MENENVILFRVHETAQKMVRKRGYRVSGGAVFPSEAESSITRSLLSFGGSRDLVQNAKKTKQRVCVYFLDDPKIVSRDVDQYLAQAQAESETSHVVLIFEEPCATQTAKHAAQLEETQGAQIELFSYAELFIDVTEHVLVPRHELLSEEEKQQVLKELMIGESQAPRMPHSDPVAKYFGARKRQMFRVYRKSPTCGESIAYRVVW